MGDIQFPFLKTFMCLYIACRDGVKRISDCIPWLNNVESIFGTKSQFEPNFFREEMDMPDAEGILEAREIEDMPLEKTRGPGVGSKGLTTWIGE